MNSVTVIGVVTTQPDHRVSGFTHSTAFDITVTTGRRENTLHVTARNDLAKDARHLHVGEHVAIVGYLLSDAFDMPDRTVWYRVEIVADQIDRQPAVPLAHVEFQS